MSSERSGDPGEARPGRPPQANRELRLLKEQFVAGADSSLRALFDFMPQLGWTARPDGFIDFYNQGWYEYTGTTWEEMQGWGWKTVHDPAMLESVLARWQQSLSTQSPFEMEFRLRRRDGVFRWFLTRVSPIRSAAGELTGWIGINTDIEEQKAAAVESDERFRLLVQSVRDHAIVMLDAEGRILSWNSGAEQIQGHRPGEIIGQHFSRFYPPAEVAAGRPAQDLALAASQGRLETEGDRLRKDGSKFWASVAITALHSQQGAPRGFALVTRDDSSRRLLAEENAERQLVADERDQLFRLTSDLVGVAGFDGYYKRLNPSWRRTLGWSVEELLSRPWIDFVHPEDVEGTLAAGGRLSEGASVTNFVNRYRCKDGSYRWLDWRAVPLLERQMIYAIARDVTEQREAKALQEKTQQQLILADRMVSVGTLAAGVAHEINNPLAYVTANLDMLLEEIQELGGGSPSARFAELEDMVLDARRGADRVRKIVRGMKTFSRADEERRTVLDVKPVLELSVNMAFNEIRHRARLVKDYGESPLINADDARLGQVFINLLVNAAQAIPEGNAQGNEIRLVTATDARGWAVVEVRDSGAGMEQAVLDRIFEPFFTTKAIGVGTGLGLSICHNIVTGMGGEITVSSKVGGGTAFRIALPPAATPAPGQAAGTSAVPASAARASVLIVDDEPAIGSALRRILRGHDVTVITKAREALDLVAAGHRYDVMIFDVMMPEMSGIELYQELARRWPEVVRRVVFMTGGAFTPEAESFLASLENASLRKPFTPEAVRTLVVNLLEEIRPADR